VNGVAGVNPHMNVARLFVLIFHPENFTVPVHFHCSHDVALQTQLEQVLAAKLMNPLFLLITKQQTDKGGDQLVNTVQQLDLHSSGRHTTQLQMSL